MLKNGIPLGQSLKQSVRNVVLGARQSCSDKRQFPNAGEESIREFAGRVADVLPRDGQVLVLFEEDKVKRMSFGRHVHLLHTWAFMVALERMNVIPSADDLHRQVEDGGRTIARDVYERRASDEGGDAQDWTGDYDRRPGI